MCLLFLASLMPSLLTAVKSTSELVHSEVSLLSALAALHKVVETLPHFISPYLEGVLLQVSWGDPLYYTGWPGKVKDYQFSSLYQLSRFLKRSACYYQMCTSFFSVVPSA